MLQALKSLFTASPLRQKTHETYLAIAAQARQPFFYRDWQVADTTDGRFDMIVMHVFLVLSRCETEPLNSDLQLFGRLLQETFFSDMDRSLREMGASDTGVGMRVKKMAEAFFGRMHAYRLAISDEVELTEALARNVYREKPVARDAMAALAAYMERQYHALQKLPVDALLEGRLAFL